MVKLQIIIPYFQYKCSNKCKVFEKKKCYIIYILSQFCLKSEISYYLQFVACYFLYKSTENPEVKALKEQLDNERKK